MQPVGVPQTSGFFDLIIWVPKKQATCDIGEILTTILCHLAHYDETVDLMQKSVGGRIIKW